MLIGRIRTSDGITHVRVEGDSLVPISDPYEALADGRTPRDHSDASPRESATVLAPSVPFVVVGIAQNGPGHPSPVLGWLKSPRSVVGSDEVVRLRRDAGTTVAEAEIAIVIGRETQGLTAENAHEYVLGVTAVNDLSSPDRGEWDPRNFESKSGEGYTPLGPWIDTAASIDTVTSHLAIDGVIIAETSAADLPISVRDTLAYLATWTTLGPGDVVMTGAPFTGAPIEPGVLVEVRVGDVILRTPTI